MNPPIHIIGCGNIGRRVARLYLKRGIHPIAHVQSDASQAACQDLGLSTRHLDLDHPFSLEALPEDARLLYTVPPPRSGTKDTRLSAFLATLDSTNIRQFVLISTTGVYGDCQGQWVDENTPIHPKADRAKRRADAEHRLQRWAENKQINYIILRTPGIYAPDRLPLKRLQSDTPVVLGEQSPWSNRIHADDLASVCYAALNSSLQNEIINVADDAPSTISDYFRAVADYAGLPPPPQITLKEAQNSLSSGMLSYLAESRRIDNTKMKKLLKVKLQYPSLQQGLK